MGEQDRAEREKFENELKRILKASDDTGIILRVIGSLAFQMHCPKFGSLQAEMGRAYTDIDFAAYRRQDKEIQALIANLGYHENLEVFIVSEGERDIFERPEVGIHINVFYDKLDFSHVIHWEGRLEVDHPSIPLAEMLLEKMQILQINEKDIIDAIMLLLEHSLGDEDHETINIGDVARLREAAELMIQNHHHRLVVIDRDDPQAFPLGIISSFDIVAEMAKTGSIWQIQKTTEPLARFPGLRIHD